jgi:GT2 family glycosyltransferase
VEADDMPSAERASTPTPAPPSAGSAAASREAAGGVPTALLPIKPIEVSSSSLGRAVEREVSRRRLAITAVVPCFNRPGDIRTLLADFAEVQTGGPDFDVDLHIVIVDNASTSRLSELPSPPGLEVEHLRLPTNTGGSGGYNAGLALALDLEPERLAGAERSGPRVPEPASMVWLVDSDARVKPGTLLSLLAPMLADPSIVIAGAALHDVETGACFEVGGRVNRRTGRFEAAVPGGVGIEGLVECDYVAACCALARADAVRRAGLMPDVFLNADDVEWCIRLAQVTGGRVVAVPSATAMHPRCDRPPGWQRYYMARNALGPLWALGTRAKVRRARARHEVARAVHQHMLGRGDHAELHLRGLRDWARHVRTGPGSPPPRVDAPRTVDAALAELAGALGGDGSSPVGVRAALSGQTVGLASNLPDANSPALAPASWRDALAALGANVIDLEARGRWGGSPRPRVAIVPTRRTRGQWFAAPVLVLVGAGGAEVRRAGRFVPLRRATGAFIKGTLAARSAARAPAPGPSPLDLDFAARRALAPDSRGWSGSLDIIVLSFNRWPALEKTLVTLLADPAMNAPPGSAPRRVIVVDNHSTDGTPARVREMFPQVQLIQTSENLGVEAFNRAVRESTADAVLLLDDDARPAEHALAIAMERLATRPWLDAVTLNPVHPRTGGHEWPFADSLATGSTDAWPFMGCANLVRRAALLEAGGYCSAYFLYRNDADLALSLLGRALQPGDGRGGSRSLGSVHFDAALRVWHDSPAAPGQPKSVRWHELATRNWIWTARRHGAGWWAVLGATTGWIWAHKLAGWSWSRHAASLRGVVAGVTLRAPDVARAVRAGARGSRAGSAWRRLVVLRIFGLIDE